MLQDEEDVKFIHPDEINVKPYEKGLAHTYLTKYEVYQFGNLLKNLSETELKDSMGLVLLHGIYTAIYKRTTEREGLLDRDFKALKKRDQLLTEFVAAHETGDITDLDDLIEETKGVLNNGY